MAADDGKGEKAGEHEFSKDRGTGNAGSTQGTLTFKSILSCLTEIVGCWSGKLLEEVYHVEFV